MNCELDRAQTDNDTEEGTSHQGQACGERGEGSIREIGRDDAQEACGEIEEKGEEEQDDQVMMGMEENWPLLFIIAWETAGVMDSTFWRCGWEKISAGMDCRRKKAFLASKIARN